MKIYEHLEKIDKQLSWWELLETRSLCTIMWDSIGDNNSVTGVNWHSNNHKCFKAWDKCNSNITYPVPHKKYSNKYAYDHITLRWNPFTQYGKDRRALLKHCIQWFKERDL